MTNRKAKISTTAALAAGITVAIFNTAINNVYAQMRPTIPGANSTDFYNQYAPGGLNSNIQRTLNRDAQLCINYGGNQYGKLLRSRRYFKGNYIACDFERVTTMLNPYTGQPGRGQ
jgi:general stress protein 26